MTQSLPTGAHIGTVTLRVRNLDNALHTYRDGLGFRVLSRNGAEARLGAERPFLRLLEDADAPARPRGSAGLFHVAYLLPSREALGSFLRHAIDTDLPLEGASDHLVSEAIYLSDPDGNGIEVYADRPRDHWWKGDRLEMATEPMDARAVLAAGANARWTGAPDGTRVGHIHLQVPDVPVAERFYRDQVGFDLTARYGAQASFLSAGRYHHHVGLNSWGTHGGPPRKPGALGLVEYEIALPSREDVAEVAARLDGEAFTDPGGNRVRLTTA